jgi:hypothetical protein
MNINVPIAVAIPLATASLMTWVIIEAHSAESPSATLLNKKGQAKVMKQIELFEGLNSAGLSQPICKDFKLVSIRISMPPPSGTVKGKSILKSTGWTERWRISECGVQWDYSVRITADGKGGLAMEISPRGGGPGTESCNLPNGKELLLSSASCLEAGGKVAP